MTRHKFEFTPEILAEIEEMAGLGLLQKDIALCLGICPQHLSTSKGLNQELDEAIKRGNAKGLHIATGALRECIADKEIAAIIYYLKVKHGWREPDQDNDFHKYLNNQMAEMKAEIIKCQKTT